LKPISKIVSGALVLIFLAGFTFLALRPVLVIEAVSFQKDRVLYRKKIEPGYEFATLIKHSVHLSPVYEYYRVEKDGQILITGTRLQDLGWGVPSTFDYDFRFEDDFMVIENMDKPIEFVPFRVSYIAHPRLLLDNLEKEIDLTRQVSNWERVDIFARRIPYIKFLIRGETDVFSEEKGR